MTTMNVVAVAGIRYDDVDPRSPNPGGGGEVDGRWVIGLHKISGIANGRPLRANQ